jgi:ZIP family zinc transporter/zinc and cadmium transporter
MTALTTSLLFSSLAAGADLVGGAVVTTRKRWDARFLHGALALGSGFMLAATLLDIIPASLANHDRGLPFWILAGYLFVNLAQRSAAGHTHSATGAHDHGHAPDPGAPRRRALFSSEVGLAAFVGLIIHTFFDGVAIGAGFQVTPSLGLLIFMAVILHKVPEGLTLASIILSSGGRRSQAIAAVAMIGLATVAGTLLANRLTVQYGHYALAISGGVMLYVAASDLVPEISRAKGSQGLLLLLSGVTLYALTEKLLRSVGL